MGTLSRIVTGIISAAIGFGKATPQNAIQTAQSKGIGLHPVGYQQHGSTGAYKRGRTCSPKSVHEGALMRKSGNWRPPHQGLKECARRRKQNGTQRSFEV